MQGRSGARGMISELNPDDFKDKNRRNWFDMLSIYSKNFIHEGKQAQKHKDSIRQQQNEERNSQERGASELMNNR